MIREWCLLGVLSKKEARCHFGKKFGELTFSWDRTKEQMCQASAQKNFIFDRPNPHGNYKLSVNLTFDCNI